MKFIPKIYIFRKLKRNNGIALIEAFIASVLIVFFLMAALVSIFKSKQLRELSMQRNIAISHATSMLEAVQYLAIKEGADAFPMDFRTAVQNEIDATLFSNLIDEIFNGRYTVPIDFISELLPLEQIYISVPSIENQIPADGSTPNGKVHVKVRVTWNFIGYKEVVVGGSLVLSGT